jgi:NADPH:quinone reductase-like Zn-dependent oxidoreductase
MEFAGTIEKVGKRATQFGGGDYIFGSTGSRFGVYAEYFACLKMVCWR